MTTRKRLLGLAMMGFVALTSASARAEHTRPTNPNMLGVEALGRGLLYSVDYDRVMGEDMVAGFGIGSTGTKNSGPTVTLLPIYANWYFIRDQGSPFLTAGASVVTSSNVQGLKSTA